MRHGARSFGHTLHVSLAVLLIGGGVMFEFSHSALWAARNKGVSRGRQQYWVLTGKVESREVVCVCVRHDAIMQVSAAVNCPKHVVVYAVTAVVQSNRCYWPQSWQFWHWARVSQF